MSKTPNNYKHIQRVTSSYPSRPLLTGIHYEDGNIIATDSNRLLILKNKVPKDINLTMHPKSMDIIEGNFPDVDRLIPKEHSSAGVLKNHQVGTLKQMLAGIPANNYAPMTIKVAKKMIFQLANGISCEIELKEFTGEKFEICCQPIYLKHAVEFILDQKPDDTTIGFVSPMRPFVLSQEEKFEYLISPIRKGGR